MSTWATAKQGYEQRKNAQASNFSAGLTALEAKVNNQSGYPSSLTNTDDQSDPLKTWSLADVDQSQPGQTSQMNAVVSAVNNLQLLNTDIKTFLDGPSMNADTLTASINGLRIDIDKLKGERSKARELTHLRKEQASALETKYASNLHTSWLGLWRPLSDQSQVGLMIFAILFGAVAIGLFGYLAYTLYGGKLVGGGGAVASSGAAAAPSSGLGLFE
jgi:hypothetical protein